ncbi:hypothetical protein ASB57_27000 [Bordetella sp. N]|nr:hypothetical protein ASB57_27000 [Bordetella sp. N]
MVLGFPPGGGADAVTRLISEGLALELKQPVIVENRPGAGGVIASDYVGRATPDGYTLLVGPASQVIGPNFYKMAVDPVTGFEPISQMVSALIVLAATNNGAGASWQDFRARVKANPRDGVIASSGVGTVFHLSGVLLSRAADIPLQHVPYKGGGPAVVDLIAGQVPIMIDTYFTFKPFLQSGKVKVWATLGKSRSPLLPDVPTLAELGYPDVVADNWYGLFAPKGTPPAVVDRLAQAVQRVLADPASRKRLEEQGAVPIGSDPAAFKAFVQAERGKWADVVRKNDIRAD